MSNLINEELETMKYLFGYQKGKVISEQGGVTTTTAVPSATTAPDVIKKIQEVLNTKYGAKLNIDGKWGNLTQSAFESIINQLKK